MGIGETKWVYPKLDGKYHTLTNICKLGTVGALKLERRCHSAEHFSKRHPLARPSSSWWMKSILDVSCEIVRLNTSKQYICCGLNMLNLLYSLQHITSTAKSTILNFPETYSRFDVLCTFDFGWYPENLPQFRSATVCVYVSAKHLLSVTIGWPTCAICKRIWCCRPVTIWIANLRSSGISLKQHGLSKGHVC